ncbi:MAG: hypothetical protein HOP29_03635 [Phycisphaerales bacterium]|nr:hypothetical protein [Phycisphaerales bacterium]
MRLLSRLRLTGADWAFVTVLLVVTGGTAWRWHAPAVAEIAELTERIVERDNERAALSRLQTEIETSDAATASLETRLAAYEHAALTSSTNSDYLGVVSRLQEECRLTIKQLSPGPTRSEAGYDVRPVEIVATGDFGDALCFLEALDLSFSAGRMAGLRLYAEADKPNCELSVGLELYVAPAAAVPDATDREPEAGD